MIRLEYPRFFSINFNFEWQRDFAIAVTKYLKH
jgi:hypothetical protein